MEPEQLAEKAATLRAIYEPRYAFPEWTVHELGNGNLMKHAEMAAWPGRLGIGRVGHRELVTRNNSTGHPCLVIGMSRTLNLSEYQLEGKSTASSPGNSSSNSIY